MAFSFGKRNQRTPERGALPVAETDPSRGLSAGQVAERMRLGYDNAPVDPPGKTVKQIIFSNVFTD